ncbi:MAG: LemA family protein [Verrucomicrobiales bacterium]|nr:LemA family protein [Verrucomicrobiales bacterium]
MLIILLVILGAAAVAVFWVIGLYNGLVTLRNRYKNGFSQIDVQLKRRYDLIPNLVETAKAYMAHEKDTLEAVIQARNQASSARQAVAGTAAADNSALKSLTQAEAGLTAALSRFSIVQEAYPDLKANQNMMQLTEELTSTENKIAFARQAYNDAVMNYNTRREMFPTSFIAGMFNFTEAQSFEVANDAEREAVKIRF